MSERVFLVDAQETAPGDKEAVSFEEKLSKFLENYASVTPVHSRMIDDDLMKSVTNHSCVVVMNSDDESSKPSERICSFFKNAVEKGANIYPVALKKSERLPLEILKDYQSFDVYAKLKERNLDTSYVDTAVNDLGRDIISAVIPNIYNNKGIIFLSHKRLDGEDIAAALCDALEKGFKDQKTFRDVVHVGVGENAQEEITKYLARSDLYVLLQTPEAHKSPWIMKELRFALIHEIPVVWIKINQADSNNLPIRPYDKPQLTYDAADFTDPNKLNEIRDKILDLSLKMRRNQYNPAVTFPETMENILSGKGICQKDKKNNDKLIVRYKISVERHEYNYQYNQRPMVEYVYPFGRTVDDSDFKKVKGSINDSGLADHYVILSNQFLDKAKADEEDKNSITNVYTDFYNNFYKHWDDYLDFSNQISDDNPQTAMHYKSNHSKEIIISGAFPANDESYKPLIVSMVIEFAKSILASGYQLTFGSHPTFQELFMEIASEYKSFDSRNLLNMYISKYFRNSYEKSIPHFKEKANLIETEAIGQSREESLTEMRKRMICRNPVKAVICIGGLIKYKDKDRKEEDFAKEGVREEIKLAREQNIPVFVVGFTGGCAGKIADEYRGKWDKLNPFGGELNEALRSGKNESPYGIAMRVMKCLR